MGIDDAWHLHVHKNYDSSTIVGYDPKLYSYQTIHDIQVKLAEKDIKLQAITDNLVDQVWTDKPKEP